jgi:hypothetical protein
MASVPKIVRFRWDFVSAIWEPSGQIVLFEILLFCLIILRVWDYSENHGILFEILICDINNQLEKIRRQKLSHQEEPFHTIRKFMLISI